MPVVRAIEVSYDTQLAKMTFDHTADTHIYIYIHIYVFNCKYICSAWASTLNIPSKKKTKEKRKTETSARVKFPHVPTFIFFVLFLQVAIPSVSEDSVVSKWSELDGGRGSQAGGGGSKAIERVKNRDYDGSLYMVNKPPRWNDQVWCAPQHPHPSPAAVGEGTSFFASSIREGLLCASRERLFVARKMNFFL